jgi:hypothetical protein
MPDPAACPGAALKIFFSAPVTVRCSGLYSQKIHFKREDRFDRQISVFSGSAISGQAFHQIVFSVRFLLHPVMVSGTIEMRWGSFPSRLQMKG